MKDIAFTITGSGNLSLSLDHKSYMINTDHINYDKIIDCLKTETYDLIDDLLNILDKIVSKSMGEITFKDGTVYWNDVVLHNTITERIKDFYLHDLPYEPLLNLIKNLWLNPSENSREQLYRFLDTNALPMTPDGQILFYKRVGNDYKDIYTGTIDNSVGARPSMPREEVNENASETCSSGLHVCSLEYLKSYGRGKKIVVCKVNPAHVVSVPTDYKNTKVRVSDYEVVGEWDSDEVDMFDGDMIRNSDGSEYTEPESDEEEWYDEEGEDGMYDDDGWDDEEDEEGDDEMHGNFSTKDLKDRVACGAMSGAEASLFMMSHRSNPEPILPTKPLGIKPDGSHFHNVRNSSGRFTKQGE